MHPVLGGACVPFGEDSSEVWISVLNAVEHGASRDTLEGCLKALELNSLSARYWIVLIVALAPSCRPTPYWREPAHLATDSVLAAMTDLRASLRRKDTMRSGRCLPEGWQGV